MAELVTIAEFDNINEAYVLKTRLEAANIRVYLQNENINSILPAYQAFGGVKLQVNLHDSLKAMDIIYSE